MLLRTVVLFGLVALASARHRKCYSCSSKSDCEMNGGQEIECDITTQCYMLKYNGHVMQKGCTNGCNYLERDMQGLHICTVCNGQLCNFEGVRDYNNGNGGKIPSHSRIGAKKERESMELITSEELWDDVIKAMNRHNKDKANKKHSRRSIGGGVQSHYNAPEIGSGAHSGGGIGGRVTPNPEIIIGGGVAPGESNSIGGGANPGHHHGDSPIGGGAAVNGGIGGGAGVGGGVAPNRGSIGGGVAPITGGGIGGGVAPGSSGVVGGGAVVVEEGHRKKHKHHYKRNIGGGANPYNPPYGNSNSGGIGGGVQPGYGGYGSGSGGIGGGVQPGSGNPYDSSNYGSGFGGSSGISEGVGVQPDLYGPGLGNGRPSGYNPYGSGSNSGGLGNGAQPYDAYNTQDSHHQRGYGGIGHGARPNGVASTTLTAFIASLLALPFLL